MVARLLRCSVSLAQKPKSAEARVSFLNHAQLTQTTH
jgi:hypothetical protein